jgi:hypothetical protein
VIDVDRKYITQKVFPEPRPEIGSQPVPCHDRERPWWIPALDALERQSYPPGWDDLNGLTEEMRYL